MSKVKVTQEQAGIVENLKNKVQTELKEIKDEELHTLISALMVGYEVEPEFREGDWIFHVPMSRTRVISSLTKDKYGTYAGFDNDLIQGVSAEYIRHATPKEIAEEKERRWWARHNRDVWEIKQGDVLMATCRHIFEVTADPKSHEFGCYTGNDEFDFDIEECRDENWKVICFAEDRKDIEVSK